MNDILLTAFGPYGKYARNASEATLRRLESSLPEALRERVRFRVYPVDFAAIAGLIEGDLTPEVACTIHLGQAPGRSTVDFEQVGRNVGQGPMTSNAASSMPFALDPRGPEAFESELPLDAWATRLETLGLPARVSRDAGAYLCNAATYWSLRRLTDGGRRRAATFLHLPCAAELTPDEPATLPLDALALAAEETIRLAIAWVDERSAERSIAGDQA